MRLTTAYLADHLDAIPQLAAWSYAQWRPIFDQLGKTLPEVIELHHRRAQIEALPMAVVALADGVVIGTGALKTDDLPLRPNLTPWLGGMFVDPSFRNRGVGGALVERLLLEARRLRMTRLYLWTPASESLYARHGCATIERLEYCGYQIALMELDLQP